MADRIVKVTLSAEVAAYKRGMLEAAQATRTVGTESEKLAQTRQAMQQLGQAGVVAGSLITAGIGVAIAKFAEFDQQMSYVQAATGESAENMALLRDAALEAGASTVFSATESAAAIEELAKAGISTADILGGGLKGALDLAAAGGLAVADAAAIAATTMQQFQLSGEDATHVADLLAAGAAKAMGDVSDLSAALNQSGLVAAQFGVSVEETTGTLAAFAQAGLLGSDAGTSFRTMLLRMANPTKEVSQLMDSLGFSAYDASGQFIGLAGLAGELETSLAGMTQAQRDQTLAMIFGQDAIRAANILLREGEEGIRNWTTAVDDQGFAAETAAARLDNLMGDWEAFTGALDTAFIQMGAGANGPLRALIQGLTALVEGFTELPAWVQQGTLVLAGVVGVIGLVGGAALLAVPKIVEFRIAMQTLGLTAATAKTSLASAGAFLGGPWGIAISVAVAAATIFIAKNQQMAQAAAEFRETLDESSGAITDYTAELVAKKLEEAGAFEQASKAGVSQRELTEAILEGGSALDSVNAKLRDRHDSELFNADLGNTINTVREMRLNVEDAAAGFENIEAATEGATGAASENEAALAELSAQAEDTGVSIQDLADNIRAFGGEVLNTRDAQRQFEAALDDVQGSLKKNGSTLDVTTEKGRANQAAVDDVAKSTLEYAAALLEQTGDQEKASAAVARGRSQLIAILAQFGITGAKAEAYADKLGLIPENVNTDVAVNTTAAQAAINRFIYANDGRRISMIVDGVSGRRVAGSDLVARANGGIEDYQAFASGGFPTGIYAGRPESIHKFAEPETIWEAYISGKPDQRDRNIGIWQETGRRLGVDVQSAPSGPAVVVDQTGASFFSYDPTDIAKAETKQWGRALSAAGLN